LGKGGKNALFSIRGARKRFIKKRGRGRGGAHQPYLPPARAQSPSLNDWCRKRNAVTFQKRREVDKRMGGVNLAEKRGGWRK